MKLSAVKDYIPAIVSYLFILLFVYAAVSKMLEFENFQAQLGQSPLISAHTGMVSYGVLITEIGTAILLAIPRWRIIGLHAAFSLMVVFTVYIVIILGYSTNIPCSCGGILENMDWNDHLFFNISFTVLAIAGVLAYPDSS